MIKNITFSVLVIVSSIFCQEQKPTVAVLRFENNSLMEKEAYDGLKKGLCDMMVTELKKISALKVLEREKLEAVLTELELAQSDVIDVSSAPKIGKLLGAQHLMFGGFVKDLGKKIRIDIRMVKVETGEVIKAVEATGKAKALFKLIKKLSYKIADELEVKVTKEDKKLIEKSDKVSMQVLLVYSEGLELLDGGKHQEALKKFTKALDMDKSFERAKLQIKKIEDAKE
ncbi:CsgG/HfaB family protein [Fibrobacterota bacterium]